MSSFTGFDTELNITYVWKNSGNGERNRWKVSGGFEYYLERDPSITVHVPDGFITDGASTPRIFWMILPPWGPYGQAAVLHDYLLEVGQMRDAKGQFIYCTTRKEARDHFSNAMRVLQVPVVQRKLLELGVWVWDLFKRDRLR